MSHFDVIGIGVNVVDILLRMPPKIQAGYKHEVETFVIQGGGPAGTASCVCASLGCRTGFVARMGENLLSQIARLEYQTSGVLPHLFIEDPAARPCIALVQIDAHTAERTIFSNWDMYHPLRPSDLPLETIKQAKALVIDGYEPEAAEAALEAVRGAPCRTVLDLELDLEDSDPTLMRRLLSLGTDIILPITTAQTLTGKNTPEGVLQNLAKMTEGQLVVTDGARGSWALTPKGLIHQKAFPVKAVDTTGCGDVFHGAYAVGLLEGMTLAERLEFAAWIASLAACQVGGRTALLQCSSLSSLDQSMLSGSLRAILGRMGYFHK